MTLCTSKFWKSTVFYCLTGGPPLDLLQWVPVLLVLGASELNAVLQITSHQRRVKGDNNLPQLAGHAVFEVAQDMAGFLGCKHISLAHAEGFCLFVFLVNQQPRILPLRAAFKPVSSPASVLGIALTWV